MTMEGVVIAEVISSETSSQAKSAQDIGGYERWIQASADKQIRKSSVVHNQISARTEDYKGNTE
jgi:hypothetical protein